MKPMRLIPFLLAASVVAAGSAWPFEGARQVPARELPVPETASPQLQALIAAPFAPTWNAHPQTAQEWKGMAISR
jgi:epsilon-lactone hydrolase